jgi:hypothetical protein
MTTSQERAAAERRQLLKDLARLRKDLEAGRPTGLDVVQQVVAELPPDHPLRNPKPKGTPVTDTRKPPVAARDQFAALLAGKLGQVPAEPGEPSEPAEDTSPRGQFAKYLHQALTGVPHVSGEPFKDPTTFATIDEKGTRT